MLGPRVIGHGQDKTSFLALTGKVWGSAMILAISIESSCVGKTREDCQRKS
jgi:hypothetical protein